MIPLALATSPVWQDEHPEENQQMNEADLITRLEAVVKAEVEAYLRQRPMVEVASLNAMQALALALIRGRSQSDLPGLEQDRGGGGQGAGPVLSVLR